MATARADFYRCDSPLIVWGMIGCDERVKENAIPSAELIDRLKIAEGIPGCETSAPSLRAGIHQCCPQTSSVGTEANSHGSAPAARRESAPLTSSRTARS